MKYLILAACLAAQPALAADRLTVMLDWFVNPDHAPVVLAAEKGFFADEGLEVEIVAPADPADPPKLVAAGRADLCAIARPHLADPAWTLHEAAKIGIKQIAWPKQYLSGKSQYEANLERAAAGGKA